jgi:predicted AlkP superfamily pyrophosphatase or phosphodiesterase
MPFVKPDYNGNSIVNLTSSILKLYNVVSPYSPLKILPQEIIEDSSNLVFFIIDGLGYNFIKKHAANSMLHKYIRGKITSVFPSTTAAAMLTYYTGLAPLNHGIPAWFTYLREIGAISAILPFTQRGFKQNLSELGVDPKEVYRIQSLFDKIEVVDQYLLMPDYLIDASLTKIISKKRKLIEISDLHSLFSELDRILNLNSPKKKFIFVYWSELDNLCHSKGVFHQETLSHFNELDRFFQKYIPKWKSKDLLTKFIISADHGVIDNPKDQSLHLDKFPEIKNCLTLPLAGEPRVPFFYVRADQKENFERSIQKAFTGKGRLYTRKEVLDNELLGLFDRNENIPMRIGDYIFIFDKAFILRDTLITEKPHLLIGNHGGLSEDEMFVPLIVI